VLFFPAMKPDDPNKHKGEEEEKNDITNGTSK
jgi:hypothetical protein